MIIQTNCTSPDPPTDETSLEKLQVYAPYDDWHLLDEQRKSDLEAHIQNILKSA